jgi:hypothetical protein
VAKLDSLKPKDQTMKAVLAAAALSLVCTSSFAAVDMKSPEPQVIEGQVGKFLEPGLFWLTGTDGVKVLIYSNRYATQNLRYGKKVRVMGTAPMDWLVLSEQELNARTIIEL